MTDIERKRADVKEIIEKGLLETVKRGVNLEDREVEWRGSKEEYIIDILCSWIGDEDGDIAIDRLVNLIIY